MFINYYLKYVQGAAEPSDKFRRVNARPELGAGTCEWSHCVPTIVSLSAVYMIWVHQTFILRAFYENNLSVIATQRSFCRHFGILRAHTRPFCKHKQILVSPIRRNWITLRGYERKASKTAKIPENVQLVRAIAERSLCGACGYIGNIRTFFE